MADFRQAYIDMLAASPYIVSLARKGATIIDMENYTYEVVLGSTLAPLNSGTTLTAQLVTQGDSDFVLESLSTCVNLTPDTDMSFNKNILLQIQDLNTGKFFFPDPTPMALASGQGGAPFIFVAPRVISPNGTLNFSVTNRDLSTNYNQFFIAMQGIKLYYA